MKRCLSFLLILALFVMLLPTAASMADDEKGEMLIHSDPVQGSVGDIVKVNFFCYPNLPDGRKLDSLSGSMKYDPAFLTIGSINQVDEKENLTSLMKGKASSFQYNYEKEPGLLLFTFIDAYGVDAEGFWFQIEFRIEQEGATDFIFNGITYTGLDDAYKTVTYVIDPVSVGGVYTVGQSVPTEGAAEETFAPLEPVIQTPEPKETEAPRPSNGGGQVVPVTTELPEPSINPPSETGPVTPQAPVTSIPMDTPGGSQQTDAPATQAPATGTTETQAPATGTTETQAPATGTTETQAPATGTTETQAPQAETPAPQTPEETDQGPVTTETEQPGEQPEVTPDPAVAEATIDASEQTAQPEEPTAEPGSVEPEPAQPNRALVIAVIAGIIVVILLAVLAIVLILIRNKRLNSEDR